MGPSKRILTYYQSSYMVRALRAQVNHPIPKGGAICAVYEPMYSFLFAYFVWERSSSCFPFRKAAVKEAGKPWKKIRRRTLPTTAGRQSVKTAHQVVVLLCPR